MIENPREKLTKQEKTLRDFALAYPTATEDFPWGHRTFKVNKKAFVFMATMEGITSLSLKLPKSNRAALQLKNSEPTHYGLGKHGWVSFTFDSGDDLPIDQLKQWIDESFRAVAPKTLVKKMDGTAPAPGKKAKKRA
jgi:predicted DNA-binding protein (MmcQ/YjbR family)